MKTVLIDADSILYIIGWASRDLDDVDVVLHHVDVFMQDIVLATGATAYLGVFSPKHTFRHEVSSVYKANRPPIHPGIAKWKQIIIDYCISEYGFFVADNIEADDVLSILGKSKIENYEWTLSHIDKDLRQIPGTHYNYAKKTWEEISEDQALELFWTQVIVGDTGDNVKGAWKLGPVGARKLLAGQSTCSFARITAKSFKRQNKETWKEDYKKAVTLIRLLDPTPELVELYASKIQLVKFEDEQGLIEGLLNHDNGDNGVLSDSKRSHSGDVLRPADDFSQQV